MSCAMKVMVASSLIASSAAKKPKKQALDCVEFKDLPKKFEPSGAAIVNGLVYSVSDDGHLAAWKLDGTFVGNWVASGDFEALTATSQTSDFLYIGQEYPATIHEWSLVSNKMTGKKWTLPGFSGNKKHGMEGLTYVASQDVWYAGSQNDGGVYQYKIDLTVSGAGAKVGSVYKFGFEEISGLSYDSSDGTVYAVSDTDDKFVQFDIAGTEIRRGDLGKAHWEGIAPVGDGHFILADDGGAVMSCAFPSSGVFV